MQAPSMPNYGLLNGLAEGVKSGLNSYLAMKQINHQNQMQELMTGYTQDENGNLVPTPQKQLAIEAEKSKNQGLINEAAGGPAAKAAEQFYAGQGYKLPEGQFSFGEQKGVVEPLAEAKAKAAAMAPLMQQRLDLQQQRMGLQNKRFEETQNQNSIAAGKQLEEDPIIKDLTESRNSLSRGRNLLNGSTPLTYNNLNAVQQDVINGMVKGGQSSEGKVSREMQESWRGAWNNLMAKAGQYGPDNDIRKQDPGLAKQIGDLLEDVDSSVAQNLSGRYQKLGGNFSESSNPKVKAIIQRKMDEAKGLIKTPQAETAQASAHPEAAEALAWAKANPNDPRSKKILERLGQ